MNPRIISLGTALPTTRFSQEDLRVAYHAVLGGQLRPRSLRIMDKVFGPENGIQTRALALEEPRKLPSEEADAQHERFRRNAVDLATQALRTALGEVRLEPAQLRCLVACTCTGYLCPGITSYLSESLALREDLQVFDLVGMGCGAALPSLNLAYQLVRNAPDRPVGVVAVEVCSATAYFDDDPELIVSNCIFGDGAAAAIVTGSNLAHDAPGAVEGRPAIELVDFESSLWPEYRDRLRFRQSHGRLRNCLSRDVPELAAEMAARTLRRLLERHALSPSDIRWWAIHPGGKQVLERFAETVGLGAAQLQDSYRVLANCGNMSSPSVLFVLDSMTRRAEWRPGEWGICSTFGAGLSCHVALVRAVSG